MTALSIPERAREIAERVHSENCHNRTHGHTQCQGAIASLAEFVDEVLHSEREQVCKELEAIAAEWIPESVTKYNLLIKAVTRLREGGQK